MYLLRILLFISIAGCCTRDDAIQSIYVYDLSFQLFDANGVSLIKDENGMGLYEEVNFYDANDIPSNSIFQVDGNIIQYKFPEESFDQSSLDYYLETDANTRIPFTVSYIKESTRCEGVLIVDIVLTFNEIGYSLLPFETVRIIIDP